jgi:dTDP-L-rhamnose 4-epimerase
MYEVESYTSTNTLGTAVLLQQLIARPVSRLVVASSMSLYGEGSYERVDGTPALAVGRTTEQLRRGEWEPRAADGSSLRPMPTSEMKTPALASVYALSKYDQERLCLLIGEAYRIPTVALRLFNVAGTRQALSNPYTGVLAIFASRLVNGKPPLLFEDGLQQRDFVDVRDVARAFRLALEVPGAEGFALNIGSGTPQTIRAVAHRLADVLGLDIEPEITGRYRVGDVRHCFASIELARRLLGYDATVAFDATLDELVGWLDGQVAEDRVLEAQANLIARGLTA